MGICSRLSGALSYTINFIKPRQVSSQIAFHKYNSILSHISKCENDEDMLFNLFSMATMPVIGGFRIAHTENCMSFTARCIELSGCCELKRPYWRYSIKDIDEMLSTDFRYFEGRIVRHKVPDDGYMTPFEPVRYLFGMIRLFSKLTCRCFSAIGKTDIIKSKNRQTKINTGIFSMMICCGEISF